MQDNNPNSPGGDQFAPTSLDSLNGTPPPPPVSDPSQVPSAPYGNSSVDPLGMPSQQMGGQQQPAMNTWGPPPASGETPATPPPNTPSLPQTPQAAPTWDTSSQPAPVTISSPADPNQQFTSPPPTQSPTSAPDPMTTPPNPVPESSQASTWPQQPPPEIPPPPPDMNTSSPPSIPIDSQLPQPGTISGDPSQGNNPQSITDPMQPQSIGGPVTQSADPQSNSIQPNTPTENVPTDLSHLIGSSDAPPPPDFTTPPTATGTGSMPPPPPNTTVPTPPAQPAEGTALAGGKHMNLSVVLIIVGVAILLLVTGLSAYFFFGPGKTSPESSTAPASVPATNQEQTPLTNPPRQVSSPSIQPSPLSSDSGALPVTSPVATASATSAIDLLKSKQSPTPSAKASGSPKASSSPSPQASAANN